MADGRRVVVLDDVTEPSHVAPFVPGAGGSVVLVTSNSKLVELTLDGATVVEPRAVERGRSGAAAVQLVRGRAGRGGSGGGRCPRGGMRGAAGRIACRGSASARQAAPDRGGAGCGAGGRGAPVVRVVHGRRAGRVRRVRQLLSCLRLGRGRPVPGAGSVAVPGHRFRPRHRAGGHERRTSTGTARHAGPGQPPERTCGRPVHLSRPRAVARAGMRPARGAVESASRGAGPGVSPLPAAVVPRRPGCDREPAAHRRPPRTHRRHEQPVSASATTRSCATTHTA